MLIKILIIIIFFTLVSFSFLIFNMEMSKRQTLLIKISIFFQFLFFYLTLEVSLVFIFLIEFYIIYFLFLLMFHIRIWREWWVVMFIFSLIISCLFYFYEIVGLGGDLIINSLFFFILLKYGLMGSILIFYVYMIKKNNFLFDIGVKFIMFFYILNSKIVIFFYGIFFLTSPIEMCSFSVFNLYNTLFILGIWLIVLFVSWNLLFHLLPEEFILNSFCSSQFMLLISLFVNVKIFFITLGIDVILLILFFILVYNKINLFSLCQDQGKGLGMFMYFIISSQCLGIPPFPSFYLEIHFLIFFYFSFNYLFTLFVIFICFCQFCQFFFLCYLWIRRLNYGNKIITYENLLNNKVIIITYINIYIVLGFYCIYGPL